MDLADQADPVKFLIRDRDEKFPVPSTPSWLATASGS
jgi:hypothetical protein